jgi:hypothetical protein
MKYVDLLANDLWSSADIDNRARAEIASVVSEARQNELRTIMLGHIAQMRTATAKELGEIYLVKTITEAAGARILEARLDAALLSETMAYELAQSRLALPEIDADHPAAQQDALDRAAAQAVIDAARPEVLALALLRSPPVQQLEIEP